MRNLACLLVLVCACGDVIQPPAPVTVSISPAAPITTDDLVANVSDGEGRTFSYNWSSAGGTATGETVPASMTTKGETWKVEVVDTGVVVGTAMVTIGDAPFTLAAPTIKAPTWANAPLMCAVTATDPDNDPVNITVSWEKNGTAYAGMVATITNTNDTIPKGISRTADMFKCTVTASQGSTTKMAEASVTITPRLAYTVADSAGMLQTIDLDTGALANVGPLGVGFSFGDIAWDRANQKLYLVDGRGSNSLYTVNTTTGAATLVGAHNLTDLFALAFAPDGLYGITTAGPNTLYKLDPATGTPTLVAAMPNAAGGRVEGLIYDNAHNRMIGENISGLAYVIDVTNGNATSLSGSATVDDFGLTYDPYLDRYYRSSYGGRLEAIDSTTFASTVVVSNLGPHCGIALPLPPP